MKHTIKLLEENTDHVFLLHGLGKDVLYRTLNTKNEKKKKCSSSKTTSKKMSKQKGRQKRKKRFKKMSRQVTD